MRFADRDFVFISGVFAKNKRDWTSLRDYVVLSVL